MTRLHSGKVTFIYRLYELGMQVVMLQGVYTPTIRVTELFALFSQHH